MELIEKLSGWFLENGPIGVLCLIMLYFCLRSDKRNNNLTDKLVILIENNTAAFVRLESLVKEMKK